MNHYISSFVFQYSLPLFSIWIPENFVHILPTSTTAFIESSILETGYSILVDYLYFAKAFDKVSLKLLLSKLFAYGIQRNFYSWDKRRLHIFSA